MSKFFRRGISKVHFLPAVADPAAPTRPEITAGDDLTPGLANITGTQFSNSPIDTPDMDSAFTTSIPGEDTTETPTLTFYDDDAVAGAPQRTVLAKGTEGFLLLLPYGDTPTKRAEVWPVTSTGVNDEWSAGNDPARLVAQFAVTGVPEQNAVIPA